MTKGMEYLGKYYSCYRGFVIDIEDPEGCNRIKVNVPQVTGRNTHPVWATAFDQFGGKNYGIHNLPQKGDIVWVQFESGNPNFPLWSHGYYGKGEKPEEFKRGNVYGFKSPGGHTVFLDDDKDEPKIRIKHSNELSITITNEGIILWGKDRDIVIKNQTTQMSIDDAGCHIDTQGGIWLNGNQEVLYNKIPGATEIAEISQIGISTKVKVG